MREHKISGYSFESYFNQTGLESEPIKFEGKWIGFQCKYYNNLKDFFTAVGKSLEKAYDTYKGKIDKIFIYTHQNLTRSNKPKKRIETLAKKNKVEISWITQANFDLILSENNNTDIYHRYFTLQDDYKYISDCFSIEERTFLESGSFIDLPLSGRRVSQVFQEIISQKTNLILGYAGTGKTQILKKIFLGSINAFKSSNNTDKMPIPLFIRLRECIDGDLESLVRNRLNDYKIEKHNDFIVMLDGLDEINFKYIDKIID